MKKLSVTLGIILALLFLISFITPFCDFYTDFIYPVINNTLGSVTGIIPFALGEIIMYLAAIYLITVPVLLCFRLFIKKAGFRKFLSKYIAVFITALLVFLNIYMFNWFIPFRSSVIKVGERTSFTTLELASVRNMLVNKINELSKEVGRQEDGHIIYDYEYADIIKAMQAKASDYPRLKGHYSPCKIAMCSDFLEWMGIGGYTYPYTMEPTIQKYIGKIYLPTLISHELSHHKGYYRENEANFLSLLSLADSDNYFLQYCAYIEMYYWLESAFMENYEEGNPIYEEAPFLEKQVWTDIITAQNEANDYYEENVNQAAKETFQEVSEDIADKGWEIQGDILQENTYDGVVLMLLQYYLE